MKFFRKIFNRNGPTVTGFCLASFGWMDCVPGLNRGGSVDTLRRFIYIHGTADEHRLGVPVSHGCIRMANSDVVDLFTRVGVGTLVTVKH